MTNAKVQGKRGIWDLYEVNGGKLTRLNKFSPKTDGGYFMANHKNRQTCGKTGYTEFTTSENKE